MSDPVWDEWAEHVRTEVVPKISESALCVAISPPTPEDLDIKFCVELGAMICLDKPVILVVPWGRQAAIPAKLRDVADAIIVGSPGDEGFDDRLMAAVKDVTS
jgi:hypothetical protein